MGWNLLVNDAAVDLPENYEMQIDRFASRGMGAQILIKAPFLGKARLLTAIQEPGKFHVKVLNSDGDMFLKGEGRISQSRILSRSSHSNQSELVEEEILTIALERFDIMP